MSIGHRCLFVFILFWLVSFAGCAHLTQEVPAAPDLVLAEPAPSVSLPASFHRVAPGETVWAIARHYDMTVEQLVGLNGIADVRELSVGTELIVPEILQPTSEPEPEPVRPDVAAAPVQEADPSSNNYRVRRGETLWRIARRHGMTPSELAAMNGLREPERLRAGRVIRVPGGAPLQQCACESPAPPEISGPVPVPAPPEISGPVPVPAPPEISAPVACETPPVEGPAPAAWPASGAPYAAIDAVLGVGDGYLDSARFDEAIDMADLGLDLLGDLWVREDAGARIARAEILRGIAHVALERPAEGRASFRAALRVEPEIVVGTNASPKVQEIFDSARAEVTAALH